MHFAFELAEVYISYSGEHFRVKLRLYLCWKKYRV